MGTHDLIGHGNFRRRRQAFGLPMSSIEPSFVCIRQLVPEFNCFSGHQCRSVEVTPSLVEDVLNASSVMSRSEFMLNTHPRIYVYRCDGFISINDKIPCSPF